jgi:hypothetical protein
MEEPAAPTRATESLPAGTKIHIIARNPSTTVVSESDYVSQSDGSLKLFSSAQPMELEDGASYYFTAYAYLGSTALPTSTSMTPYNDGTLTNDFLLSVGGDATKYSASGKITLPTLKRRFSRVKYSLSAIVGGTLGAGFEVSLTNNYAATLTKTGATVATVLTKGGTTTAQPLFAGDTDAAYRIVYTGEEPPALNISGSVDGKSFSNVPVIYKENSAFKAGKSYILQINIKQGLRWAGSNIYWEATNETTGEGYLTFADSCTTTFPGKQFYRGVFFKWGSLVGNSPVGDFAADITPIYVPTLSGGTITWNKTTATAAGYSSYADIPNVDVSYPSKAVNFVLQKYDSFLTRDSIANASGQAYNATAYGGHDPEHYKGDICKYLSGQSTTPAGNWVMPTIADFQAALYWQTDPPVPFVAYWHKIDPNSDWGSRPNPNTATNTAGKYSDWTHGASLIDKETNIDVAGFSVFPASGFRRDDGYELFYPGAEGFYWSSSVYTEFSAYNFQFYNNGVSLQVSHNRKNGYPVRCVLLH